MWETNGFNLMKEDWMEFLFLVTGANNMSIQFPIYTGMVRGGVPYPIIDHISPSYLPQYDTTWCPEPFIEDLDNQPHVDDTDESKLRYLCTYDPEFGHKIINYRTIVGLIHMTFAMRKIVEVFFWFPRIGDPQRRIEELSKIDIGARAFFDSTTIWDETFSLMHTVDTAYALDLSDFAKKYEFFTLKHYPFIKSAYDSLQYLFKNLKDTLEQKIYLLSVIFNEAGSINAHEILSFDPSKSQRLPFNQNVDARFLTMLNFCEKTLRKNQNLTVEQLTGHLLSYLKEKRISINILRYDKEELEELHEGIEEDYMDGLLFISMYHILWHHLIEDMEKLRIPGKLSEYPVSACTIRPQDKVMWSVCRKSLLFSNGKVSFWPLGEEITVRLNKACCFTNLLPLGETVEAVLRKIPVSICHHGVKPRCQCGSLTNCFLDKVIKAFQGKFDPSVLEEELVNSLIFKI